LEDVAQFDPVVGPDWLNMRRMTARSHREATFHLFWLDQNGQNGADLTAAKGSGAEQRRSGYSGRER
ncbi:hypothetical protein, partial [Mesorhizobium sp. M7A.F.Ca.ET.027.03.2.1]|uniref:hypothetical protein n=1 Tax=Mesorhizobium sp. M7A.F.Ca.ET.027.03.2.1 TaxID=2496656 RepID=UPI001AECAB45